MDGCNPSNMWCYVCEVRLLMAGSPTVSGAPHPLMPLFAPPLHGVIMQPPSEDTSLASFSIFPEPQNAPTWQAAAQWVTTNAQSPAPQWNYDMVRRVMAPYLHFGLRSNP